MLKYTSAVANTTRTVGFFFAKLRVCLLKICINSLKKLRENWEGRNKHSKQKRLSLSKEVGQANSAKFAHNSSFFSLCSMALKKTRMALKKPRVFMTSLQLFKAYKSLTIKMLAEKSFFLILPWLTLFAMLCHRKSKHAITIFTSWRWCCVNHFAIDVHIERICSAAQQKEH